ncbi:MAG: hypothetical protein IJH05_08780 [Firmicutes bacterium]|nr:hypothetical protein [Bacillota bacterium]
MIFKTSSKIIAAVLTAALALSPIFVTPISATDGQEVEMDADSWRYQDGDIIEEGNVILPEDADDSIVEDYNSQMGSSFEEQTEEPPAEPVTDSEEEAVQAEEVTAETPAEGPAADASAEEPIPVEAPAEEPIAVDAPAEEPIPAEAPADQQTAVQAEMPAQEPELAAAATGKYWKWSYNGKTIVSDGGVLKGIDVSYWQGTIDWAKVKKAGVDFAIIRCGYGSNAKDNDDTKFAANVRGCVKNGIPYGVYLYSHANTVAKANDEANHALRLLKANNCKLQYPIYYDLEDKRVDNASNATIRKIANTFCAKMHSNGYPAGVYANLSWWNNQLSGVDGYDKWVAQWAGKCTYGKKYSVWQCTSSASVSGISGRIDANLLMCPRSLMDKYMNLKVITYSFQTIDGKQYLVSSEGNIIKNRFFKHGGYIYGFDADGVKQAGKSFWIGSKGYILDKQGRAYINKSKTKKKAPYYAKAGSGKKGKLKKGKTFYVLRTSGKWSQMSNGYWIKTKLIKKTTVYPNVKPAVKVKFKAKLKKKTRSYSGPSKGYIKKKNFKKNKIVTVIGTYGSWGKLSSGQWLPLSKLKK